MVAKACRRSCNRPLGLLRRPPSAALVAPMHAVVNPACHGARDSIGLGPRYRLRVQRPHVYGDEKRFRANLAQHVQRARALLDEAEGVRKRIDKRVAATSEAYRDLTVFAMGHEWTEKVAKWRRNAGKFATAHLGISWRTSWPSSPTASKKAPYPLQIPSSEEQRCVLRRDEQCRHRYRNGTRASTSSAPA